MRAYVLTLKGNDRLIDGKLPFYPSCLPDYDLVYAVTPKDELHIPRWYLLRNTTRFRVRTWCCWQSKLKIFKKHLAKYPTEDLLFMEDDVRFLPGFDVCYKSFMDIVPDDWGIIWFGGKHLDAPKEVKPGVLKCSKMCNSECILIRSTLLPKLVSMLESEQQADCCWSDQVISASREYMPHYAPLRQFAWQQTGLRSDIRPLYTTDCRVFNFEYIDTCNNIAVSDTKKLLKYT